MPELNGQSAFDPGDVGGSSQPPGAPPAPSGASDVPGTNLEKMLPKRFWGNEALKGYQDLEKVADRLIELETKTKAGKLIEVPEGDNPEALAPILRRLGYPEKPEGYELKKPEGLDISDDAIAQFAKDCYEDGLTKAAAQKKLNREVEKYKAGLAARQKKSEEDKLALQKWEAEAQAALTTKWGAQYSENQERVTRFFAAKPDLQKKLGSLAKDPEILDVIVAAQRASGGTIITGSPSGGEKPSFFRGNT